MSVVGLSEDGIVWPIEIEAAEFLMGLLATYAGEHREDLGVRQLIGELAGAVADWKAMWEDDE